MRGHQTRAAVGGLHPGRHTPPREKVLQGFLVCQGSEFKCGLMKNKDKPATFLFFVFGQAGSQEGEPKLSKLPKRGRYYSR